MHEPYLEAFYRENKHLPEEAIKQPAVTFDDVKNKLDKGFPG